MIIGNILELQMSIIGQSGPCRLYTLCFLNFTDVFTTVFSYTYNYVSNKQRFIYSAVYVISI